jgi:hypothetical protein
VNVLTAESIECLLNPNVLTEKLQVEWTRLLVPGLSHQVLQFQSTCNRELPGVEFYVDRIFASETAAEPLVERFRSFLLELTVPTGLAQGVASAPPRVLFIWPGVITVQCVLRSVEFRYQRFGVDGRALVYTATVGFEEVRDGRGDATI